ncbi:MAG TPA: hypothetical protein VK447_15550 [Myxococcaceae bacterium]|nr:hypothetical protein [Myxococcaceae bacterium]
MNRTRILAALLAGSLLASPAFAAEPAVATTTPEAPAQSGCDKWPARGLQEGPVGVGYYEADFATGRRACPRTEIGIGMRGGAIIDTPNFYGAISADALLFGSVALNPRLELFGTLEVVHYQWIQNASLRGDQTSMGQATAGATYVIYQEGAFLLAPSARMMLPTSTASANVRTMGLELGAAASYRAFSWLEVHGYAGGDMSMGFSAAPTDARFGLLLLAGVQWSPLDWLGVVLDMNGHFGARAGMDYMAPVLGVRVRIYEGLAAELGMTLPMAGADRHDALGGLKITYRL